MSVSENRIISLFILTNANTSTFMSSVGSDCKRLLFRALKAATFADF